ncbi:hypothetical protein P8C59_009224 [Phyllachora maydis]|uniref:Uncharacterized protein n=1 Tax=Phyllachora maydis TaxID=1825666 RepID=A0AAD9IC22_9PEZI|nr:hypothetical protein P8C59_009224 [Phyllachora maydis]
MASKPHTGATHGPKKAYYSISRLPSGEPGLMSSTAGGGAAASPTYRDVGPNCLCTAAERPGLDVIDGAAENGWLPVMPRYACPGRFEGEGLGRRALRTGMGGGDDPKLSFSGRWRASDRGGGGGGGERDGGVILFTERWNGEILTTLGSTAESGVVGSVGMRV